MRAKAKQSLPLHNEVSLGLQVDEMTTGLSSTRGFSVRWQASEDQEWAAREGIAGVRLWANLFFGVDEPGGGMRHYVWSTGFGDDNHSTKATAAQMRDNIPF